MFLNLFVKPFTTINHITDEKEEPAKEQKILDTSGIDETLESHTDERRKIQYWEDRWVSGNSPWHKTDNINAFLEKYFDVLQVSVCLQKNM